MSEGTAIEKTKNAIAVWDNLAEVRAQFAPTLTDKEFAFFVTLGKSLNANPFKREIWAVKYDKSQPASIFLGRDMYRRRAQEQEDYNGHVADSVYEKDTFKVVNGTPQHEYSLVDRGRLLGAYCVAWKKGVEHPLFVYVKFDEYNKGFANWKSMPDTMIKKVAESQCLRAAWQGIFAGTYDESEQWEITSQKKAAVIPPPRRQFDAPVIEATTEPITEPRPEPQREPVRVQPGETEPPDDVPLATDDSDRPNFTDDVYGRLDSMIYDYCKGNANNMKSVYKTLTTFKGTDGRERYCLDVEQLRRWKPGSAEKAKRNLEQRMAMKTKFSFETE